MDHCEVLLALRVQIPEVMAQLLTAFTAALAPIMPHMAEDAWQRLPYPAPKQSVFQAGWPAAAAAEDADLVARWERVRAVRDVVNKVR